MTDGQRTTSGRPGGVPRRHLMLVSLPLLLFLGLAILFAVGLRTGDPSRLPSQLIGLAAPRFELPAIEGLVDGGRAVPGLSHEALGKGEVAVINVWASWCAPCLVEHPQLMALAKLEGVALYGINHKDKPADARRFLGRHGNPFRAVGADQDGRAAIEWGVYGVPETFILDKRGVVLYRHAGAITPEILAREILPVIRRAQAG